MLELFFSLNLYYQYGIFFIFGLIIGILLMNIFVFVKNKKINLYKRQLEKEAINSDNSEARVKVLESKIQVLEKALENALNREWYVFLLISIQNSIVLLIVFLEKILYYRHNKGEILCQIWRKF